MSLAAKLLSASGGVDKLYVDDVFSAYTYTGNSSTHTINNGIDLAGKGGLVWCKQRSDNQNHVLFDSARGAGSLLFTDVTIPQGTGYPFSLTSTGFSLGSYSSLPNTFGGSYASWTFRKSPKFFDVVTYTGNGSSSRSIAHSLGQEVGMVMTKATSTTGDWNTYHRSATGDLVLNSTVAQTGSKALVNSATTSTFTVSGAANTNGVTYVAYLFAHDTSADGIIQCGSYTGNGSTAGPIVNLGWEPQYLMIKNASGTGNWQIIDNMRGMPVGSADATLQANLSSAEPSADYISPTATGFQITSTSSEVNTSSSNYTYLAIRRPNKPPTTGTQVYNAIARTGAGGAATVTGVGFAPDLMVLQDRGTTSYRGWIDRLRGKTKNLISSSTGGELDYPNAINTFLMDGYKAEDGTYDASGVSYINHFFKRAPGVFDVVCYTGTGAAKTEAHSLGVVPELMIVKSRSINFGWYVYHAALAPGKYHRLDYDTLSSTDTTVFNSTAPTISVFTCGTSPGSNYSTYTFVAYLFATKAGISKVGSYTGNGTSQTIDCGFTTGARFVMIKRTDAAGDWYVWDTVRGLVAGNDPHLSLNSTTAEITTDDSLDPASVGFIVNQLAATNINVTSASYIYLSFA